MNGKKKKDKVSLKRKKARRSGRERKRKPGARRKVKTGKGRKKHVHKSEPKKTNDELVRNKTKSRETVAVIKEKHNGGSRGGDT